MVKEEAAIAMCRMALKWAYSGEHVAVFVPSSLRGSDVFSEITDICSRQRIHYTTGINGDIHIKHNQQGEASGRSTICVRVLAKKEHADGRCRVEMYDGGWEAQANKSYWDLVSWCKPISDDRIQSIIENKRKI